MFIESDLSQQRCPHVLRQSHTYFSLPVKIEPSVGNSVEPDGPELPSPYPAIFDVPLTMYGTCNPSPPTRRYPVADPLSDVLIAVIVVCTPPLVLLLPRDPLVRRWQVRRSIRRFRRGVR